jgi:hypothetical protein
MGNKPEKPETETPETETNNFNKNRTADGRILATNIGTELVTVHSVSIPSLSVRDEEGNVTVTTKPDRRRFVYQVEGKPELFRGNVPLAGISGLPSNFFKPVAAKVSFHTSEVNGVETRFEDTLDFEVITDNRDEVLATIAKMIRGQL